MKSLRKKFKGRYLRRGLIYFLSWCLVVNTFLPAAMAEVVLMPGGEINGSISVTPLGGGTVQDMTASNGAIGHFSDFDIASGHFVNCVQPGGHPRPARVILSAFGWSGWAVTRKQQFVSLSLAQPSCCVVTNPTCGRAEGADIHGAGYGADFGRVISGITAQLQESGSYRPRCSRQL